jgi:uncharacterized protein (UPF0548 family)
MIRFRRPPASAIQAFLHAQAKLGLSYSAVGATAGTPPTGYNVDRARVRLGEGDEVFRAAKSALCRWEHFRLGWCEAWPAETPIKEGEAVAVLARSMGLWWLNAARIIYVVDKEASFGFAYGTLPGHAETGEERFLVEWDQKEGGVWYDIPGLLAAASPARSAGLSTGSPAAGAIPQGLGGGYAEGGRLLNTILSGGAAHRIGGLYRRRGGGHVGAAVPDHAALAATGRCRSSP